MGSPRVGTRYRNACLGLALALAAVPASAGDDLEYKVKAAFLFNFARFVTWPQDKYAAPDSPIEICVLGDGVFTPVLIETVRDKSIAQRPLLVRRSVRAEDLRDCHVVYVVAAQGERTPGELAALAGHGVLTVHEATAPLAQGVVRFFLDQRRVRFEINAAAAARENLQLSSRLLSVASVVQR